MEQRAAMDKISFIIILAVVFLLPIFFVPSSVVPFQLTKTVLLNVGVLVALFLWIIARLKDGVFTFQKNYLTLSLSLLPVAFLIASLFSGSISGSLIGQGGDIGTFTSVFVLSMLMFLVSVLARSKERIFYVYLSFLAATFVTALFHLGRLVFGPDFMSFGIFTESASNFIGKWNDLGLFFGFSAILSLITLELLPMGGKFKVLLYSVFGASILFAIVVNFSLVWYLLAIFSLVFFVYLVSFGGRKISTISLVTLIISLLFLIGGNTISQGVASYFKVRYAEVRPSWGATMEIAKNTLAEHPLWGAGPNRFVNEWLRSKPAPINNSVFWNTDFIFGIGLLPTFLVTVGVIGIAVWIAFILLFANLGFRSVLSPSSDAVSRYLTLSSFFVSIYLWLAAIFYVPSLVLIALAFIFSGLTVAAVAGEANGRVKEVSVNFLRDPKVGFMSILGLVVLLMATVVLGYMSVEKYIANIFFQKSMAAANANNLDLAESNIVKAASISLSDYQLRALAELGIARMSALLNRRDIGEEALRTQFRELVANAAKNAKDATSYDPTNYQNWLSLGRVYEAVLPLGIAGAYENARVAYDEALRLNPRSPAVYLTLARLEMVNKKYKEAKQFIASALQQKNDYTEAIFLLSQIEVEEGNIKAAIGSVEAAAFISPNDQGIQFQLGLLRYADKNWKGAAEAFGRAVALNNSYANARYFLGLSLVQLGQNKEAIEQFEVVQTLNPDNQEIALILQNLKAGRTPFANAKPPVDSKPEKRSNLPVKEK